MKTKRSYWVLWLPTLTFSVVIVLLFSVLYLYLHHNLDTMIETHKRSQELTKKTEKMVSSTLNGAFLGNEEKFLKTVTLSNEIENDILLLERKNTFDTAPLSESYEQLYKKLISVVSYTHENRIEDARDALVEVETYANDLEKQLEKLNAYLAHEEKNAEQTLFLIVLFSGLILLSIALFNGFYLIPRRVIHPLEQFSQALQESEEKYRIVADWTYDWEYWLNADKSVVFVSPSVERITGYTPDEFTRNPSLLSDIIYSDDTEIWHHHTQTAHLPNRPEDNAEEAEFRIIRKDGRIVYIDHICRPVYDSFGKYMGVRVANRDVTQKIEILAELREKNRLLDMLAITDGLSGLYNRRYFDEVLAKEVERSKRSGMMISLIMCDIDYFKYYNDTYGHQKGDEVIKSIADVLGSTFNRQIDVVARYGGEEFIIILPSTPPEEAQRLAELARIGIVKLGIEHTESKTAPCVTMSFGIASGIADRDSNGMALLKHADEALYESKGRGRNCTTLIKC